VAINPVSATPTAPVTTSSKYSAELLARDVQRKVDLKAISAALTQYFTESGKYPSTGGVEIKTKTAGNVLARDLVPTYLSNLPVDPMTDMYYYGYKSDGTSYELSALLGNDEDPEGTLTAGKNFYIIKN
jgi:hypothetical protein